MYQHPTLFPQISNRESWIQTIQIYDDDTGDLIDLTDDNGNALYGISLEIRPSREAHGYSGGGYSSSYYGEYGGVTIFAVLDQGSPVDAAGSYITIVDTGTIAIQIPKSIMQTLRHRTYDVFLGLDDTENDDGRQLIIGKLPVFSGGRT